MRRFAPALPYSGSPCPRPLLGLARRWALPFALHFALGPFYGGPMGPYWFLLRIVDYGLQFVFCGFSLQRWCWHNCAAAQEPPQWGYWEKSGKFGGKGWGDEDG